jgi:diaminopimelate decarboxylase
MTCDGRDVIVDKMTMPENLEVGDWISLGGMGSYTIGPKSKFNGMVSTRKIYSMHSEMVESIS